MYQRPFLDDRGVKSGTASEKRAILTSCASDASAIASCPALRAPAGFSVQAVASSVVSGVGPLDVPAGTTAILTSSTPGVTVLTGTSAYGAIPAKNVATGTPFVFTVAPSSFASANSR